jgi:hypothetical protein
LRPGAQDKHKGALRRALCLLSACQKAHMKDMKGMKVMKKSFFENFLERTSIKELS